MPKAPPSHPQSLPVPHINQTFFSLGWGCLGVSGIQANQEKHLVTGWSGKLSTIMRPARAGNNQKQILHVKKQLPWTKYIYPHLLLLRVTKGRKQVDIVNGNVSCTHSCVWGGSKAGACSWLDSYFITLNLAGQISFNFLNEGFGIYHENLIFIAETS